MKTTFLFTVRSLFCVSLLASCNLINSPENQVKVDSSSAPIELSRSKTTVYPPRGFCALNNTIKNTKEHGFLVMSNCQSSPTPIIATVSITPKSNLSDSISLKEAKHSALSRNITPQNIDILHSFNTKDVTYSFINDTSSHPIGNMPTEYWRATLTTNTHLVTVTATPVSKDMRTATPRHVRAITEQIVYGLK